MMSTHSARCTNPLVRRIVQQTNQPPDASEIRILQLSTRKQKDDCESERLEQVKNSLPTKTRRAVGLSLRGIRSLANERIFSKESYFRIYFQSWIKWLLLLLYISSRIYENRTSGLLNATHLKLTQLRQILPRDSAMVLLRWLSSCFLISKRNIQGHQKDTLDLAILSSCLKALNDRGCLRLNQVVNREFKVKSPPPKKAIPVAIAWQN